MIQRKKAKTYDLKKFLNVERPTSDLEKVSAQKNEAKEFGKKVQKKRKKLKLSAVLVMGFLLYVIIILGTQQLRLYRFEQGIASINKEIEAAERQQEELLNQMELMKQDEYIERIAREKLGLVKPGEIPYIAVPSDQDQDVKVIDKDPAIVDVED